MSRQLLSIACHAYGAAAIVYLGYLVRQWSAFALLGRISVAAGLIVHAIAIASGWMAPDAVPLGVANGLSLFTFLLLAIYLMVDLRFRRPVLGAFITPAALAIMVPAFL